MILISVLSQEIWFNICLKNKNDLVMMHTHTKKEDETVCCYQRLQTSLIQFAYVNINLLKALEIILILMFLYLYE